MGKVICPYQERFHAKRRAGISPIRRDGSVCDPETDRQSGHAEEFAADEFGVPVNKRVMNTGDGGMDFAIKVRCLDGTVREAGVDVIWNGFATGTRKPRLDGNLLVNPFEPHRYAQSFFFVLVGGTVEHGWRFLGWARRQEVFDRTNRDFGYGERHWVPVSALHDVEIIKKAIVK